MRSQTIAHRKAFSRGSRLLSDSPQSAPCTQQSGISASPNIASANRLQTNDRSVELDQSGFDAQSMRSLRGIGTAFIAGVCVWTILFVVGYFLWVYRA